MSTDLTQQLTPARVSKHAECAAHRLPCPCLALAGTRAKFRFFAICSFVQNFVFANRGARLAVARRAACAGTHTPTSWPTAERLFQGRCHRLPPACTPPPAPGLNRIAVIGSSFDSLSSGAAKDDCAVGAGCVTGLARPPRRLHRSLLRPIAALDAAGQTTTLKGHCLDAQARPSRGPSGALCPCM